MKLAYLVMAHEHPAQLRRLVDALDGVGASFFIHIDAKFDPLPFRKAIGERGNVHFLADRVVTHWMGFSMVEATLRLMTAAVEKGFDYCVLLSGADYPIKSNAQLADFYAAADEEYIAFWRLEDRPSWMHKVRHHYPVDQIPIRGWSTGTEPSYWRRLFWGRVHRWLRSMPARKFPEGMVPFGGPDWWSLSAGCARYVLKFVADNPRFKRFHRTTASPGELFFQTIILNSPFAGRVHNRHAYAAWSDARRREGAAGDTAMLPEDSFNYRYVDWSGEVTGRREKPAILDETDWERLKQSECHFARKFDPLRSSALLQRIDRELLGITP